eukprot:CAMPEP_0183786684 /NCGR_PEP_ID=MMETSP0739-20130205/67154_1 /TAXON_ID=385413 /ORGANISM="Thalassiosira miniscula, Strain CCMP1093" /LENGTH=542 /DNA_ID=CAMNT_0026030743 /DNA_START=227 /DNA_END=1856 /DNA_ORIENTATION=-
MAVMLENDITIGKRSTHSCIAAMTKKKRGKVLPSVLPIPPPSPPPSVVVESESDYFLCQECPADSPVTPEEQLKNSVDDGRLLPPALPARDNCIGNTVTVAAVVATTPTSNDYANLLFCESSEEEEVRANIAPTAPSSTEHDRVETPATFRKRRNKKRRRISFGAAIPTFHYLENIPPAHAMTPDERSKQWFTRSDLESFKSSAQVSIVEMRHRILRKAPRRPPPVTPEEQLKNSVDDGRLLPPALPARDNCIGNTVTVAAVVATTPTSNDYANLLFCESSEEEEVRANIAPTAPSSTEHDRVETPATFRKRRNKKRRRISFGAAIPTFHYLENIPPAHAMTPDERSKQWFTRSDLESFKSSAQVSIIEMRHRILRKSSSSSSSMSSSSARKNNSYDKSNNCNISQYKDRSKFRSLMITLEHDTNSSIRGLEHRVFRRKQNRRVLIRDVLECQAHVMGLAKKFGHAMEEKERTELLGRVSQERSSAARSTALADAKDDCTEIYGSKYNEEEEEELSTTKDVVTMVPVVKRQKQARLVSLYSA